MLFGNGAGKTTVLHALARMFSLDPALRKVKKSDFHVAHDEKPEQVPPKRELWIEADFEFPELLGKSSNKETPAVPANFAHMQLIGIEGPAQVRFRLHAKLDQDDDIEESFTFVMKVDEHGVPIEQGRVPEQGGRNLISADPLPPGTVYAAGITADGTVGLYRVEVSVASGTGKLKMAGGVAGAIKESVQRAFSYVQSKKAELGISEDLNTSDLHVEVIDLLANRVEGEVGVAFFVACYSALRKAPVSPALLVLGDMSVSGKH
jgi:hypothetical protein